MSSVSQAPCPADSQTGGLASGGAIVIAEADRAAAPLASTLSQTFVTQPFSLLSPFLLTFPLLISSFRLDSSRPLLLLYSVYFSLSLPSRPFLFGSLLL